MNRARKSRNSYQHASGTKWGHLTAVRFVRQQPRNTSEKGIQIWLFRCDCGGTDVEYPIYKVANDRVHSCGCKGKRGQREWLRDLQRAYGLTSTGVIEIDIRLQGSCETCGDKCTQNVRLSVDHCHRTGVIRGVLCQRCNKVLGLMKDRPDLLISAARYLERFNDKR